MNLQISDVVTTLTGTRLQSVGDYWPPPMGWTIRAGLDLHVGDEPVPGFVLTNLLGQGGCGEAWEATAPGDCRVCLKIVPLWDSRGVREKNGLSVIVKARHEGLVSIFGTWERGDRLVVAMELADDTLRDRLSATRATGGSGLPRQFVMKSMSAIAEVLDYLNSPRHVVVGRSCCSLIHGDVKPDNLLQFGRASKLGDFGLLKVLHQEITDSESGFTPYYVAPEVIGGRVSRWVDQYSLAITYVELRSGRTPFTGNLKTILDGHCNREPDLTMLPEQERPILSRALAKTPRERFPNCLSFVKALARVQQTNR